MTLNSPLSWKHVLNDGSEAVENFPSKMTELTITTEFFSRQDYILSSFKAAISYQRNFNLTKF